MDDENLPDADNDAEETDQKRKRKKHASYNWVRDKTFSTFEEATQYLEQLKFVKFKDTESDRLGMKFYYKCKLVPKDRPVWCARQYMIHCPHDNSDNIVYHNDLKHNHDELNANQTKKKMSDAMLDFVRNLFNMHTTQYASIVRHIENARKNQNMFTNENNPTKDQIAYRLKLFRDSEIKPVVNVGDLIKWCQDHSTAPDEPHTPFVIDHWREKNNGNGVQFRFVFTTLFLLNFFKNVEKVCIDSTYKLNWNGFPLTILGTVDKQKKFHPIAFACTTHETADDYSFVFNSVKTKIKQCFATDFQPSTLISDAADAIRNAFYRVFPNATMDIMCFAHVLRNVEKRTFQSKNNKKLIKDDIMLLQQASDKQTFDAMSKLFCAKWKSVEADFVRYFEKQWLRVHQNWFEGAAVYTPSTNNAQEAVNGIIKSKVTLRKRLPMNQFMAAMVNLISDYSIELSNGSRVFAKEPAIDSKVWCGAILMQQNSFKSFKLKRTTSHPNHLSFAVPSSKCSNPCIAYYKTLTTRTWTSFDEFIRHGFQQFYLVRVDPTKDWNGESTCTCTWFMKQYSCKHIVATALKEGITECPDEQDPMLLSHNKRKQGRSKRAEPALVIA